MLRLSPATDLCDNRRLPVGVTGHRVHRAQSPEPFVHVCSLPLPLASRRAGGGLCDLVPFRLTPARGASGGVCHSGDIPAATRNRRYRSAIFQPNGVLRKFMSALRLNIDVWLADEFP